MTLQEWDATCTSMGWERLHIGLNRLGELAFRVREADLASAELLCQAQGRPYVRRPSLRAGWQVFYVTLNPHG